MHFALIKEKLRIQLNTHAPIAQPVEQLPFKEKVPGSIPGGRTDAKQNHSYECSRGFVLAPALRQVWRLCETETCRLATVEAGSRVLSINMNGVKYFT